MFYRGLYRSATKAYPRSETTLAQIRRVFSKDGGRTDTVCAPHCDIPAFSE